MRSQTQAWHRVVSSQEAAHRASTRMLRSKDSMSGHHLTRGTRQHRQQRAASTARRRLAARSVRDWLCGCFDVIAHRICLLCKQLFTVRVDACAGSWNPGHPGTCFPKSAAAKGHSTGGMPGYAWGSNPSPLPPAPPPPPPPPSCSEPLGTFGSVVCNQTVFYKSCGMGQASREDLVKFRQRLVPSCRH